MSCWRQMSIPQLDKDKKRCPDAMSDLRNQLLTVSALFATFATSTALAGGTPTAPGPGILALLALGVVGAIGIARLRK